MEKKEQEIIQEKHTWDYDTNAKEMWQQLELVRIEKMVII